MPKLRCESYTLSDIGFKDHDADAEFTVELADGTWRKTHLCEWHVGELVSEVSLAPELFWIVEKIA